MSKKVADIIIETLQSAGVKHCYGVVGDTLNHIAGALSRSSIEWVSVRHEEAGAGDGSLDGRGLKLWPRQPALHQWNIRG
jgi:hypothetical protein